MNVLVWIEWGLKRNLSLSWLAVFAGSISTVSHSNILPQLDATPGRMYRTSTDHLLIITSDDLAAASTTRNILRYVLRVHT